MKNCSQADQPGASTANQETAFAASLRGRADCRARREFTQTLLACLRWLTRLDQLGSNPCVWCGEVQKVVLILLAMSVCVPRHQHCVSLTWVVWLFGPNHQDSDRSSGEIRSFLTAVAQFCKAAPCVGASLCMFGCVLCFISKRVTRCT